MEHLVGRCGHKLSEPLGVVARLGEPRTGLRWCSECWAFEHVRRDRAGPPLRFAYSRYDSSTFDADPVPEWLIASVDESGERKLREAAPPGAAAKARAIYGRRRALQTRGGVCSDCQGVARVRWYRTSNQRRALCGDCAHWAWGGHSQEAKRAHRAAREDRLLSLQLQGATLARLAQESGRSEKTIRQLPSIRMALLARKELRALLIKLYHFGRGDSASELAERLGLSRRQVENIINDSGQMSHKRAGVLLAFTAGALEMNGDVRGTFSDDAQVVAKRLELAQDDEALRGRLFATLDMLETWVNTGSPNGAGPPSPKLHAVP